MSRTESPVILPRRALPQPKPHVYSYGDCGACVLGGLLDMSVQAVYDEFVIKHFNQMQSVGYDTMTLAFHQMFDASITNAPVWPVESQWAPFGYESYNQYGKWQSYVRMALEAGYYGIANVNMKGDGPSSGADHWVLICGWRPDPTGVTVINEILVSCSARHPEGRWIDTRDFLHKHGGFNVMLARPK